MNPLNAAQAMLARHVIGWALVPPHFTDASCLPTTLEGARTFLDRAALQESELLRHLGIDAGHLTAAVSDRDAYDEFFAASRSIPPSRSS